LEPYEDAFIEVSFSKGKIVRSTDVGSRPLKKA